MTLDCTKSESKNTIFLRFNLILADDNVTTYITDVIKERSRSVTIPSEATRPASCICKKYRYIYERDKE